MATPSGLIPAWTPLRTSYVTRCDGTSLQLDVEAPPDQPVSVGGQPGRAGRFSTRVQMGFGQATRFDASAETYTIRCLPSDFPVFTAERSGPTQAAGYLVTAGNYLILFDSAGTPIWWYRSTVPVLDAKLVAGQVVFSRYLGGGFGTDPAMAYEVRGWDGDLKRAIQAVGSPTDHHDLVPTQNGNWLLITYRKRDGVELTSEGLGSAESVYDAVIQEVNPQGGLVWSWNSADHIALAETGRWWKLTDSPWDIIHMNSLAALADENILFSARHLDAIYKISRSTGQIIWKLGGVLTPESLAVTGDDHQPLFGAQHDARELPDGTITVHDNRTGLDGVPRAARYRIDEQQRTATQVEQVTDPAAPTSPCCGSARRLEGGDWVVSWGGTNRVAELTPSGEQRFTLTLPGFSYRAYPVPPADFDEATLQAGMDAQYGS